MDLEIEVPVRTNLELRVVNGGEIAVEGVEGNLEVNNVNGPVRLTGVSGSVVASAVNANVTVRLTRVTDAKAMAFSSLSGTVDVTLPATTKANLKLRSDNGDVFTDFDVQQTEPPARSGWVRPGPRQQARAVRGQQHHLRHHQRRRARDRGAVVQRQRVHSEGAIIRPAGGRAIRHCSREAEPKTLVNGAPPR